VVSPAAFKSLSEPPGRPGGLTACMQSSTAITRIRLASPDEAHMAEPAAVVRRRPIGG
jgi:hypothetical protein